MIQVNLIFENNAIKIRLCSVHITEADAAGKETVTDQQYDAYIKQICAGEKDGLKQIYEAYLPYIYTLIFSILRNREDAEDVTSSFFIRIWTTAKQYRPGSGHKTYISAIARNMCIDFLRKRGREIPTDLTEEREEKDAVLTRRFEDRVVENLTLREALQTLKDSEREIIHLKIAGELTFQEIADILKIPLGTVTWRYREAIKKLRRCGYEERS